EGWANGYKKNILYWEVWNEPDHMMPRRNEDAMWSGTQAQYLEMYAATSRLFKKEMPYAKIGGFACCSLNRSDKVSYFLDFLTYVKENKLPLDFFSWHIYTWNTEQLRDSALLAREKLDLFGFTETESILDEWNYLPNRPTWGVIYEKNGAQGRREVFSEVEGVVGSAFVAASLIELTELPVDIATFYDGQPTSFFGSIFDCYGVPTKQYYPFIAFRQILECGEKVFSEASSKGIYALASSSGDETRVMVTNFGGAGEVYKFEVAGLDETAVYDYLLYYVDEWRNFEPFLEKKGLEREKLPNSLYMHENSTALVKIVKKGRK
ncbi:MAG: hypothetical protein FWF03_04355, partial [Defluviitaleaceae bacterium]|nr:hypothetical protein [Defluviitaleaceae bacterium]